jgi:hypothetical protein
MLAGLGSDCSDGRAIYFNRNSVIGGVSSKEGTRVMFVEEADGKGPQASTVSWVNTVFTCDGPRCQRRRKEVARGEHFPHGAASGIGELGATPAEAFEQAAL